MEDGIMGEYALLLDHCSDDLQKHLVSGRPITKSTADAHQHEDRGRCDEQENARGDEAQWRVGSGCHGLSQGSQEDLMCFEGVEQAGGLIDPLPWL